VGTFVLVIVLITAIEAIMVAETIFQSRERAPRPRLPRARVQK